MVFNIQKFLSENKLTGQSQMREDDNTGLTMPVGDDEEMFGDEEEDDWNKPEPDASAEFEKEPTARDVKQNDASLTGIHKNNWFY